MTKGFNQVENVDYHDAFSPVSERTSIRILLILTSVKKWVVQHFDVSTAFLHASIQEEVYVKPPEPLHEAGKLWKLKKALYGLKQSPKEWNGHICEKLINFDLIQSIYEPCFFNDNLMVIMYVDYLLVAVIY